jgi:AcrR family transcriptional regulator
MGRRGPKPVKSELLARAALELFVEKGVKGATTRAIARRAHTTEASLYRHYSGKEDLARRVLGRCVKSFGDAIEQALAGVAGPQKRLRAFVQAYLTYARSHPLEHSFIQQLQVRPLSGIPEAAARPRQILSDILSDGQASGTFSSVSPRLLVPFIAGGLAGLAWEVRDDGADLELWGRALCEIVDRSASARLTNNNVGIHDYA